MTTTVLAMFWIAYGAAAMLPLLPRRWQRVEMPVAELVIELMESAVLWSAPPRDSKDRGCP